MTKIDTKEMRGFEIDTIGMRKHAEANKLRHGMSLFCEDVKHLCDDYDEAQKEIERLKSTNEIIKIEDVCPACGSKEFKIDSHLDTANKHICLTMICNLCTEELVMWDSLYEFKIRIQKELGEV